MLRLNKHRSPDAPRVIFSRFWLATTFVVVGSFFSSCTPLHAQVQIETRQIEDAAVTNEKLADVPAWSLKGRNDATTGTPQDFTADDIIEELAPQAGDFILGFDDADQIRKYDVDNLPGGGLGVTDGDKGDVTVSGLGTIWEIDPEVVAIDDLIDGKSPVNTSVYLGESAGQMADVDENRNVAVGFRALQDSTDSDSVIAIGYNAGKDLTSGNFNIAVGANSLTKNTEDDFNTAIGGNSLFELTIGTNNTAVGMASMQNLVTGNNNTAVGRDAGRADATAAAVTSSSNSVFLGSNSRPLTADTANEIVIGTSAIGAGNNTATLGATNIGTTVLRGDILVGSVGGYLKYEPDGTACTDQQFLKWDTSVESGAFVCTDPVLGVTDGDKGDITVTAGGTVWDLDPEVIAIDDLIDGKSPVNTSYYLGFQAGQQADADESNNVAIGYSALQDATDSDSTVAIGYNAARDLTEGNFNTVVGTNAFVTNTVDDFNTAIGGNTLFELSDGSQNTAIGMAALENLEIGNHNAAVGAYSLFSIVDGGNNAAIGRNAGRFFGAGSDPLTLSNTSIFLGGLSKPLNDNPLNEIVIGYNTIGAGSATVTLGNTGIFRTILRGDIEASKVGGYLKYEPDGTACTDQQFLKWDTSVESGAFVCEDLTYTVDTDTNADTECVGSTVYLDGEGNCDTLISNAAHTGDVTGDTTLTISTNAVGANELASTAVTAGTYTNADITIDADGRITLAANGNTPDGDKGDITVSSSGAVWEIDPEVIEIDELVDAKRGAPTSYYLGEDAGAFSNNSATNNVAVGRSALATTVGADSSTAIGDSSLTNITTGGHNTAVGASSLLAADTGAFNTVMGSSAGLSVTSGESNVAVGSVALGSATSGNANVAIGREAGTYFGVGLNPLLTPGSSMFLGSLTRALVDGGSNEIVIGHGATGAGSNSVTLGHTTVTDTILRGDIDISSTGGYVKYEPNGVACADQELLEWDASTEGGAFVCSAPSAGETTTVSDTANVDLTLTGSDITADLTPSVTADLALASTSVQPSDNVSTLTNDSGYLTAVAEADVTQHEAALTITESQITDLTHTVDTNTNADTECTGSSTYLDGEGNCDTVVSNVTHIGDVTGSAVLTIETGVVGEDELASTAVTAGTYTNADITVDADGRITLAANGAGAGGVSDGDKGDITVSSSGTVWEIDPEALEIDDLSDANRGATTSYYLGEDAGALVNNSATNNVAVGYSALATTVGADSSTAIGNNSLTNITTGGHNTAVGASSLLAADTGAFNTVMGSSAALNLTSGDSNIAIGALALGNSTTGNTNVAIGRNAGATYGAAFEPLVTSGSSMFLGSLTKALLDGSSNEIVIGHNATGAGSNSVTLGHTTVTNTVLRGDIEASQTGGYLKYAPDGTACLDSQILEWDVSVESGAFVCTDVVHKDTIQSNSRVYLYVDNRWITDSDDNYGIAYYQNTESGGTGVDPIIEWEHQGRLVQDGTKITSLTLTGRANNVEVTDVEVYVVVKTPNPITRWGTGYDNDGEDTTTILYRDMWLAPTGGGATFSGAINDMHLRTIPLDFTVTGDSFLSVYYKPVGALTATRYFYTTNVFNIELP